VGFFFWVFCFWKAIEKTGRGKGLKDIEEPPAAGGQARTPEKKKFLPPRGVDEKKAGDGPSHSKPWVKPDPVPPGRGRTDYLEKGGKISERNLAVERRLPHFPREHAWARWKEAAAIKVTKKGTFSGGGKRNFEGKGGERGLFCSPKFRRRTPAGWEDAAKWISIWPAERGKRETISCT